MREADRNRLTERETRAHEAAVEAGAEVARLREENARLAALCDELEIWLLSPERISGPAYRAEYNGDERMHWLRRLADARKASGRKIPFARVCPPAEEPAPAGEEG